MRKQDLRIPKLIHFFILCLLLLPMYISCGSKEEGTGPGISAVEDEQSQPDVLKIAIGSKDHSTLVAAVKAAGLVDSLANQGPFTVFAPTNEAFDKLPSGTVDNLLKSDQKENLKNILEFHVAVGNLTSDILKLEYTGKEDELGMANGGHAKISIKNGKLMINNATIIASVPASNGIVHVIDTVILPSDSK